MIFDKLWNFFRRFGRNKMLMLKIKDPGHTLNIPGFNEVRTPVEINVHRRDLNVIISYLRKNGIIDYEIKSGDKEVVKPEQKKEDIKKTTKLIVKDDSELKNKIDNIENLLVNFIKNQKEPIYYNISGGTAESDKIKKIKKQIEIEEDEDNFIPTIDISSMSTKGNLTKTTIVSDKNDNVEDSVNLLKSLNKQNRGKY